MSQESITQENDAQRPSKRGRKLSSAAVAASLALLAACTTSHSSADKKATSSSRTKQPAVSTAPASSKLPRTPYEKQLASIDAEINREKLAEKRRTIATAYVDSAARNKPLAELVDKAGARVLAAADSGKIGRFAFYNGQTNRWGRIPGNAGWGYLQHNPQYGGSPDQISALVYQDKAGNIDLKKGVLDAQIFVTSAHQSVEIDSPRDDADTYAPTKETDYRAEIDKVPSLKSREADSSTAYELSAAQLQTIDHTVIHEFNKQLGESGI